MILSNVEILAAVRAGQLSIEPLTSTDPARAPFNTSAIDLHLSNEISIPRTDDRPVQLDLRRGSIASFLHAHSEHRTLHDDQPYSLKPGRFILANTRERIDFPISVAAERFLAGRVEGKSSLARCGLLVHFTAPTIHAGFEGRITLEMINLGPADILLTPGMPICQLIVEEVKGRPADAPNQFRGQMRPAGV